MLGSALACADESAAPRVERNGQVFKLVRGMASAEALGSHSGSRERYFAGGEGGSKSTEAVADATRKKLVPEGVQGLVASKGPLANILQQLCGGARSGLAHSGASTLDALLPTVWLQTNSGATEGRPHTIQ